MSFARFCMMGALMAGLAWPQGALNVKFVNGKVELQKKGVGKWIPLKSGAKVRQADRLHTFASSMAVLTFDNGSEIKVQENSILDMKALQDAGATKLGVSKGNLLFNIKKLTQRESFEFETSTATAAIRGTQGGIGSEGGQTLAYLEEGALELLPKNGGKGARIGAREFAAQSPEGFSVRKLAENQKIADLFTQALRDSTLRQGGADSLLNRLLQDTVLRDSIVPKDSVVDTVRTGSMGALRVDTTLVSGGRFDPWPESVAETSLPLRGQCLGRSTGALVGAQQLVALAADGTWQTVVYWAAGREGVKEFPVSCVYGTAKLPLGIARTVYAPLPVPYSLDVQLPATIKVSEGSLTVQGRYAGRDATLRLLAGDQVLDLSSPSGEFRREFEISDRAGNWDLQSMDLLLSGSQGEIRKTYSLEVDRTSRKVNTRLPEWTTRADLTKGQFLLSVQKVFGDPVRIGVWVDGELKQELDLTSDASGKILPMYAGEHQYILKMEDQAKNTAQLDLGKWIYWPRQDFSISVQGRNGDRALRVPPLPPGQKQDVVETFTLVVSGLDNDDPSSLEEVLVTNPATGYRQILRGNLIDDVRLDFEVPLSRDKLNVLTFRVVPKQGLTREWTREMRLAR